MSSKSSQEAIVAQVTSNRTSGSGYITRQGSRSSSSLEKCCNSTAQSRRRHLLVHQRVDNQGHERAPKPIIVLTESRAQRQLKNTPKAR